MPSLRSGRLFDHSLLEVVVATAVLLVLAGLACSRAEASCGDWLEGHAAPSVAGRVAEINATAAADGAAPLAHPLQRPCRGPSCGRAPRLPTIPPEPPAVPVELERDAVLPAAAIVSVSGFVVWLVPDEPFSPAAGDDPAERPPRRS